MDAQLQYLVLERLTADDALPEAAGDLVWAACDGPEALDQALGGGARRPRAGADGQLELAPRPPGAYVASLAVQGFRGVGDRAQLELSPGPGLTLVVGRKGSGKSSFAEGLELLMTGTNSRWINRTKAWTEGWQNLHFAGETVLEARFHVDGEPGALRLRRTWPHGSMLQPRACEAQRADGSPATLDELGWSAALPRYRPFLSYNELGSMFDELKTMYDALAAILGLEDIEELQRVLRDARLARERAVKEARASLKALADRLAGVDDDRARAVVAALTARPPDLDGIELTLAGLDDGADPHAELAALRQLTALPVPPAEDVEAALQALGEAREALSALAGTDAARAASLAKLLEVALAHDAAHQGDDCPVCGSAGVIDERWRLATTREVVKLSAEARAVEAAERDLTVARRRVADLLAPTPPAVVGRARDLGLDPGPLEAAWEAWERDRPLVTDAEGAERLGAALAGVRLAAERLGAAAEAELDRREDLWRPVARVLADWLPGARAGFAAGERLAELKAAEQWAKATAADLQTQRLAPIAGAAKANWDRLRQDSNVSLDGFHLRKSGTTRAAEVDVKVDGTGASAFGVMSQGELHALAVSVFLPRAGLPESPFRFMVIDDPVQSMDPAKVDGLARVLDAAARTRQVVVFTHDERLPEAVRRLGIAATQLEVTRRPGSLVDVRKALDPLERYLEDARALVRSSEVPRAVAERVVPGFCRHAVEAACVEVARRRRLDRGDRHADVEAALERATTLYSHLALALLDDETKGSQVLTAVNNRWGKRAGDVVVACNKGVHEVLGTDLDDLVRDTAVFARRLADAG